ncbi:MAG: TetR/AcrR family transcriptional regulator [Opitutaceae bacterium]|nr:TetR/AcrR family transcriptional regulator [Opitutaceae bacterium]
MPNTLSPPTAADHPAVPRILAQARAHFFVHGYSAFTMDDLAAELGMSKKTLYVHFAGKDEIIGAVLDALAAEIRAEADALLHHRRLNFAEKLRGFAEGMIQRLALLSPRTVRDLQRYAPALFQRVNDLRERNIPYIFGRFIEEGQLAGMVRADLDAAFAVSFFLQAMHGLLQPSALDRLQLSPRDVLPRAIDLFFSGLLTPAGRKEHEKLFPR